jgi:hypothetical protein
MPTKSIGLIKELLNKSNGNSIKEHSSWRFFISL